MSKKLLWPALGGAALLVIGIYAWWLWPEAPRPSAEELEKRALSASSPQEREAAAALLTDWGEASKEHMRRVFAQSDSPAVRALMIQGLATIYDYDSMDLFLTAMNDESPIIRDRSYAAVSAMLGKKFPLDVNASEADRRRMVETIRKDWEKFKTTPLLPEMIERNKRNRQRP